MDINNEELRLKRIEASNRAFESLQANPDFQEWIGTITERCDHLAHLVLSTDRSQENWQENLANRLVAYQEFSREVETMFKIRVGNAQRARRLLNGGS